MDQFLKGREGFNMEPETDYEQAEKIAASGDILGVVRCAVAEARKRGEDVVDFGMGNPDGRHARDRWYKLPRRRATRATTATRCRAASPICGTRSRGGTSATTACDLDPESEAIVTIGRQGRAGAPAFAVIGPGDARVAPAPCYPIHQYGPSWPRARPCRCRPATRPKLLNRLEDLYRADEPAQADPDELPAEPDHGLRGWEFFEQVVALALKHGTWSCTISRTPTWASKATLRPASCRSRAAKRWRSRSSR